jgi:hypothetical protein
MKIFRQNNILFLRYPSFVLRMTQLLENYKQRNPILLGAFKNYFPLAYLGHKNYIRNLINTPDYDQIADLIALYTLGSSENQQITPNSVISYTDDVEIIPLFIATNLNISDFIDELIDDIIGKLIPIRRHKRILLRFSQISKKYLKVSKKEY